MSPPPQSLCVQGMGAVSSLGLNLEDLCAGIFAGRSGLAPRRRLRDTDCLTEVCAEIDTAPTGPGAATRFASAAARQALADQDPRTCGLILASTKAELSGIDPAAGEGLGNPGRLAQSLARSLGCEGPVLGLSTACASGLGALIQAGRWLRHGRCAQVLVCGSDALSPFVLSGFSALLALDPGPCRPFDRQRQGLSLGEGAGAILLGTRAPQAPHARLLGWGESNDADHVTGPSRDGSGLALALRRALQRSGSRAEEIDFIHLHGTGTPYNDAMELRALGQVFDPVPPAAGSKAQLGHCLGAAGLLESLVCIEALRRGRTPPNLGFARPDAGLDIGLSAASRELPRRRRALKLAAGFGGINSALVFGWEEGPGDA